MVYENDILQIPEKYKKMSLSEIAEYISDSVEKRANKNMNYGKGMWINRELCTSA